MFPWTRSEVGRVGSAIFSLFFFFFLKCWSQTGSSTRMLLFGVSIHHVLRKGLMLKPHLNASGEFFVNHPVFMNCLGLMAWRFRSLDWFFLPHAPIWILRSLIDGSPTMSKPSRLERSRSVWSGWEPIGKRCRVGCDGVTIVQQFNSGIIEVSEFLNGAPLFQWWQTTLFDCSSEWRLSRTFLEFLELVFPEWSEFCRVVFFYFSDMGFWRELYGTEHTTLCSFEKSFVVFEFLFLIWSLFHQSRCKSLCAGSNFRFPSWCRATTDFGVRFVSSERWDKCMFYSSDNVILFCQAQSNLRHRSSKMVFDHKCTTTHCTPLTHHHTPPHTYRRVSVSLFSHRHARTPTRSHRTNDVRVNYCLSLEPFEQWRELCGGNGRWWMLEEQLDSESFFSARICTVDIEPIWWIRFAGSPLDVHHTCFWIRRDEANWERCRVLCAAVFFGKQVFSFAHRIGRRFFHWRDCRERGSADGDGDGHSWRALGSSSSSKEVPQSSSSGFRWEGPWTADHCNCSGTNGFLKRFTGKFGPFLMFSRSDMFSSRQQERHPFASVICIFEFVRGLFYQGGDNDVLFVQFAHVAILRRNWIFLWVGSRSKTAVDKTGAEKITCKTDNCVFVVPRLSTVVVQLWKEFVFIDVHRHCRIPKWRGGWQSRSGRLFARSSRMVGGVHRWFSGQAFFFFPAKPKFRRMCANQNYEGFFTENALVWSSISSSKVKWFETGDHKFRQKGGESRNNRCVVVQDVVEEFR